MPRIMIIRHAEKHYEGSPERGVCIDGHHKKHELTVRGWLRAGALVPFFAPPHGHAVDAPISTPRSIFASAATPQSPSLRAQRTVEPLAAALGIEINRRHADGHEAAVVAAALGATGPVLISWHHSHIGKLAKIIAGAHLDCPEWPEHRFDIVWVLDQEGAADAPWTFAQVPQCLFANDRPHPI